MPKFTASGTPLPEIADTPGRRAAIDQMHTEAILEDMARDERAAAEPAPCTHPATARRYNHQGPDRVAWCHSCGDEFASEFCSGCHVDHTPEVCGYRPENR